MACSCNNSPCSCSPCQPANTVYQAACTDPGSATTLRHLTGLDSQFCERRLLPGTGGYLVASVTGSGNWLLQFTDEPKIPLAAYQAVQSQPFGNLLVQGSDNVMRELFGPAIADLYMRTNAAGQLTFEALPVQSLPATASFTDLTVVNLTTLKDLIVTGTVTMTGLSTGTIVNPVGLDINGNLVKGTITQTGSQCASFFESPTSPTPAGGNPNDPTVAGASFIIGNLLFDSTGVAGGGLFTVTNSKTITCITAGAYIVDFGGLVHLGPGLTSTGKVSIGLSVNGIIVNSGNSSNVYGQSTQYDRNRSLWGQDMRRYTVGNTIQLVLGAASGDALYGSNIRCNVTRISA